MNQLLLDSNIIIYLLNGDPKINVFLEKFRHVLFVISIITWIEVLTGSHKHQKKITELASDLSNFIHIPIHTNIGFKTAQLLQNQKGSFKNKFQDSIIAATAIVHKIPLVTNNPKDFRKFKGLKIIPVA